jgi:hypothetical protein
LVKNKNGSLLRRASPEAKSDATNVHPIREQYTSQGSAGASPYRETKGLRARSDFPWPRLKTAGLCRFDTLEDLSHVKPEFLRNFYAELGCKS